MESGLFPGFTAIFCSAAALFMTLYFLVGNRKHRNKNLPPEAAGGWPFIGHLSMLSGPELPHIVLSNMADKHGPIFAIRFGTHLDLVVNSWEVAKECFATNDVAFSNRPKTAAIQHMSYDFAMYAFSPYGSYWRELRKISMQKLLSNQRVALLGNLFQGEVKGLRRSLHSICSEQRAAEMKQIFWDLTLNLMVRIFAGEMGSNKEIVEGDKWREAIKEFFRVIEVLTIPDVLPFLKWLEYFAGTIKAFKRTGQEMDGVLQAWLDEHKKHKKSNSGSVKDGQSCSFMEEMITSAEELAQDFPAYDADTINKATCQLLMLGGTATIATTLTWALCLLPNHRHTLTRAQEELDACIGRDRQVQATDMENLVYTRAIIKETLRLYPPTPIRPPRESVVDCTVSGYHIPAGTRLLINAWKIHRDPRMWSDPLEFQPERFLTVDHKEIDVRGLQFELIPFGSGRRVCAGISFSLQVMELALASLLHGFDIETVSNEIVDMTGSLSSINAKATPLEVILKPRLASVYYD